MDSRRFVESFNAAVEGFIYVLRSERNMRIHFLMAALILLVCIYLDFTIIETLIMTCTISIVLITEMINTAIEHTVDMIKTEFHPIARIIKDVGAGAVLVASINAVIVGYALFSKRLPFNIDLYMSRIRKSSWHITFISLILVFSLSILGKLVFHRGTPLRGGMPSGHSAVAFSIWSVIAFLSNNPVVVTLSFFMAFLIARHRIKDSVHSVIEVIAGAILGILTTTMIFQIFR